MTEWLENKLSRIIKRENVDVMNTMYTTEHKTPQQ
jgi:hypothetical protein